MALAPVRSIETRPFVSSAFSDSPSSNDERNTKRTPEVAIDYNAGFTGALAALVLAAGGDGGGSGGDGDGGGWADDAAAAAAAAGGHNHSEALRLSLLFYEAGRIVSHDDASEE